MSCVQLVGKELDLAPRYQSSGIGRLYRANVILRSKSTHGQNLLLAYPAGSKQRVKHMFEL